ncbi:hypothetical protein T05_5971 [Trichinella murrelli]|uniref:Uncharacterized protein n=1 Tax=Trichinella murrelli TaxID=144512 RepID=A0A0V0THZ7_9BILA|nr:hypothetical protein T05_5971 [Trichinella murrelli]
MIDQLTSLCKDAAHPDDFGELLDDVMAFHGKTLEVQLQLEAALTVRSEIKRPSIGWRSPNGPR